MGSLRGRLQLWKVCSHAGSTHEATRVGRTAGELFFLLPHSCKGGERKRWSFAVRCGVFSNRGNGPCGGGPMHQGTSVPCSNGPPPAQSQGTNCESVLSFVLSM